MCFSRLGFFLVGCHGNHKLGFTVNGRGGAVGCYSWLPGLEVREDLTKSVSW